MDTETDGRDMEFQRGHLNRRDFLKSVGLGIGAAMTDSTLFAQTPDSPEKTERVLSEADQRIDRHRKADATLTLACPSGVSLEPGQEVAIEQQRHRFLFGSNLFKLGRCRTDGDNTAYAAQFAKLLNYATLPFYWWSYERHQGQPDEARTEEAVRWCKANDITPKGHPLAWNWVDPAWLPDDPKQAMALQLARIEQCAERFRGSIDIWDVVNEATHFDRPECRRQAPPLHGDYPRLRSQDGAGVEDHARRRGPTGRSGVRVVHGPLLPSGGTGHYVVGLLRPGCLAERTSGAGQG